MLAAVAALLRRDPEPYRFRNFMRFRGPGSGACAVSVVPRWVTARYSTLVAMHTARKRDKRRRSAGRMIRIQTESFETTAK